jgi:hypothetical protein
MKKIHVLVISAIVGLGAIVGLATAAQSAGIGRPEAQQASPAEIAAREQKLERTQASLRAALQKKPPTLPAVPSSGSVSAPRAASSVRAAAPVAVGSSRSSHDDNDDDDHDDDDGFEHEDDDGDDD